MGSYQYLSPDPLVGWTDVPDHAHPDDEAGSVMVVWPNAPDRDGEGNPCGAVGGPWIDIKASKMTGTGLAFYQDYFVTENDISVQIAGITAYNARAGRWVQYSGLMLRPTYGGIRPGSTSGTTTYRDVEIRIEQLTEIV